MITLDNNVPDKISFLEAAAVVQLGLTPISMFGGIVSVEWAIEPTGPYPVPLDNQKRLCPRCQREAYNSLVTPPAEDCISDCGFKMPEALIFKFVPIGFGKERADVFVAHLIVAEEAGELVKEVVQMTYEPEKTSRDTIRSEAVQVAAMAIRFLISEDKFEYPESPQHKQT